MHTIPSARGEPRPLSSSQRAESYVAASTHVRLVVLLALEALEAVSLKHDLGGLWADKEPVDRLGDQRGEDAQPLPALLAGEPVRLGRGRGDQARVEPQVREKQGRGG